MHPADALQESKGYIVNNWTPTESLTLRKWIYSLGKKVKQNPLEKLVGVDT